jgi:hypothetical protein
MIALFTACDPGMAFSSAPTGEIRFGIVNIRFCGAPAVLWSSVQVWSWPVVA